jgi:hypothetical protein
VFTNCASERFEIHWNGRKIPENIPFEIKGTEGKSWKIFRSNSKVSKPNGWNSNG